MRFVLAFLIILMPGCAAMGISLCVIQPISAQQGLMVVRMKCEAEE